MSSNDDRFGARGAQGVNGYTVRASHFWLGALALVVIVFGGVWLAIPGADTMHRLTAPSGNTWLDVGELCSENSCGQIIVLDTPAADGERTRVACTTELRENRPVFVTVSADWAPDENAVALTYADAAGVGGTITLNLFTDCPS